MLREFGWVRKLAACSDRRGVATKVWKRYSQRCSSNYPYYGRILQQGRTKSKGCMIGGLVDGRAWESKNVGMKERFEEREDTGSNYRKPGAYTAGELRAGNTNNWDQIYGRSTKTGNVTNTSPFQHCMHPANTDSISDSEIDLFLQWHPNGTSGGQSG